jgi:hypothetical protein
MPKFIDLTGQRHGRVVVLRRVADKRPGVPGWLCRCDCGNEVVKRADVFKNVPYASCGCYNIELAVERLRTHGASFTPTYRTWVGMRMRCEKPSNIAFHKYGAKGIRVCDRWQSFENFVADMGERPTPKHSIDRIDGSRGYEPQNCRWATAREQALNFKNNRRIEHAGKSLTAGQWSEITGIPEKTIESRVSRLGWSAEEALTIPPSFRNSVHR